MIIKSVQNGKECFVVKCKNKKIIIHTDGHISYWKILPDQNAILGRENGPSVIRANGKKEFYPKQ